MASSGPQPIVLFTFDTPNGQKLGIMMEEIGLPYEVRNVDITKGDQHEEDFRSINPNGKIPAITDPDGPGGKPINVFESGAILMYLAEKAGQLVPKDPREKWACYQWVMFQMAGVGPMLGQLNHFLNYAPEKVPYGIQRYGAEVRRLMSVLDRHLETHAYLAGAEYSIADIALYPWISLIPRAIPQDHANLESYPHLHRWTQHVQERPAVQRGMQVAKKAAAAAAASKE